jgi:hypothetical protein
MALGFAAIHVHKMKVIMKFGDMHGACLSYNL